MRILEWSQAPIEKPLVVIAIPSQDVVGAIAADFLVDAPDMWLHATVHDDAFPPVTTVRAGRAYAPIQIYAGAVRCGPGRECDQLVVVRAEIAPEPALWYALAECLLEWSGRKNARLVVALEGVDSAEDAVPSGNVLGACSPGARDSLDALGVKPLDDGAVSGFSACLLVKALELEHPAVALYVESTTGAPASEAAARLIQRLDPLIPHIHLDPKPLVERAKEIEAERRSRMDGQREAMERIQHNVMYG